VARFLTPTWLDAVASALDDYPPPLDGDARVHVVIGGGPEGDIKLGSSATADLSLTVPATELAAIVDGSLDPSVAFMQGRLKVAGDTGALFRVLAWTRTTAFVDLLTAVQACTDA